MGNFLVVIPSDDCKDNTSRLFHAGLEMASRLTSEQPSGVLEMEWVHAASFARQNGTGTSIVTDAETGSWVLTIGTWFHTEGYGSGAESRLLSRYMEVGAVRLGRELEGFFVIVLGDTRIREVIVLTDIIGSCHGFMRAWQRGVALSGSSLLLASLWDFALDPIGCQEFLYTGVIYEGRTFYRDVRKLGPAAVFRFSAEPLTTEQRYWQIGDLVPELLHGPSSVEALSQGLIHAAKKVGRLFAHPVCDLTGGYDSRTIVAAFLAAGVSFSTTVSGADESADVKVSHGIARLVGLPHLHIIPAEQRPFEQVKRAFPLTDGEYDLVEYARILEVHQALSEQFDISINGSFGEIARGYWWELLLPHTGARRKLDAERLARLRYAAKGFDPSLFPPETRFDLCAHLTGIVEKTTFGLSHLPNTLQMDYVYLMLRMQHWQGRIASSTNRLWPCLSPFLFRSIMEVMLQTAASFRRRGLLVRHMLAELEPRLAAFPLEHGYPALPATWKNLHHFWPVAVYGGKRLLSKAARMGASRLGLHGSPPDHLSSRLRLWREAEVQELLNPKGMWLGRWLDTTALADFLRRSQHLHFPFGDQWARLLSLEYTLDVLHQMKVGLTT